MPTKIHELIQREVREIGFSRLHYVTQNGMDLASERRIRARAGSRDTQ